jgi:hypothetical protein
MISQKRISIYTQLANKYNIPYQVVGNASVVSLNLHIISFL